MKLLALALTSVVLLAGCGLPRDTIEEAPSNTCDASTACGDGAACVQTVEGDSACAATSSELGSVIIEVQVPNSTSGSGASYVFPDALTLDGSSTSGLLQSLNLALPNSVPVTGRIKPTTVAGLQPTCIAQDGGVPTRATFQRRTEMTPFHFDVSVETPFLAADAPNADFNVPVPPGQYNVYLEPITSEDCPATLLPPPRLVRDVTVTKDPLDFTPPAEEPLVLTGMIAIKDADSSLFGWVLEVVDPTYGKVISDSLVLGEAAPTRQGGLQVTLGTGLRYYNTPSPIVRLRNAAGDLAIHWPLSTLDLDADNVIAIDLADLASTPKPVEATVIDTSNHLIPSANVTVQSVSLSGSNAQNATFRATATTDLSGVLRVSLVPGKYLITIVPQTPGVATHFGEWEITSSSDPEMPGGGGVAFPLESQPLIQGAVTDPQGVALPSAPLVVGPSRTAAADYFTQVLSKPEPVTRQQIGSTDGFGDFELAVDPGDVDLFVKMPAETRYPWFVLPGFVVEQSTQKPVSDLSEIAIRYPVLAQGQVSGELGPVAFAPVRAWVQPKQTDDAEAGPLVQIGATTTDANGIFVLPLPPSITLPARDTSADE